MTTQSKANYGTVPNFNPSYPFTLYPLDSKMWQMVGTMGTAKMSFGGKTWPTFYWSTQVAFNGAVTAGSALVSWI